MTQTFLLIVSLSNLTCGLFFNYHVFYVDVGSEITILPLIMCACCSEGLGSLGILIPCSLCSRNYHSCCHIPSIRKRVVQQILNKSINTANVTPNYIDDNNSLNWKCTICINIDKTCEKISNRLFYDPNTSNTLCSNTRKIIKYIVLKLYCQKNDSKYFRECPNKILVSCNFFRSL